MWSERLRCWSFFFFASRRRHTRLVSDWSSDVCSSDLNTLRNGFSITLVPWLTEKPFRSVFAITANYFFQEHQRHNVEDFGLLSCLLERSEERRVGKECGLRWGA